MNREETIKELKNRLKMMNEWKTGNIQFCEKPITIASEGSGVENLKLYNMPTALKNINKEFKIVKSNNCFYYYSIIWSNDYDIYNIGIILENNRTAFIYYKEKDKDAIAFELDGKLYILDCVDIDDGIKLDIIQDIVQAKRHLISIDSIDEKEFIKRFELFELDVMRQRALPDFDYGED